MVVNRSARLRDTRSALKLIAGKPRSYNYRKGEAFGRQERFRLGCALGKNIVLLATAAAVDFFLTALKET